MTTFSPYCWYHVILPNGHHVHLHHLQLLKFPQPVCIIGIKIVQKITECVLVVHGWLASEL